MSPPQGTRPIADDRDDETKRWIDSESCGAGEGGALITDGKKDVSNGSAECNDQEEQAECLYFKVDGVKMADLYDWSLAPATALTNRPLTRTGLLIKLNYKKIALFKYGATVFAVDEECPHLGGPLHLGDIEVLAETSILCVVCPWHKWRMELDSGKVKLPRGRRKAMAVYPVKQDPDGSLWVGFSAMDSRFFTAQDLGF